MKKLTITLFTLLLFVTGSYAQELNSKIKSANKEDIPKVSTFARMNDFSSFKAGDIVYDTNLEAHYQYMGDSTWILSDKFSPKKTSSYLAQLSSLSTLSGAPTLNAAQAAAGQVAFYTGASTTDGNSNFIWDNTNRRLGIGKSSPQAPLDVAGQINADFLNINGIYIGRGRGNNTKNTAVGRNALYSNTTGDGNTASGYQALYSNTTGFNNLAGGINALFLNTTGSRNIASGSFSLYSNTTGSNNLASGFQALFLNSTGSYNLASGQSALYSNTVGSRNIALGDSSGYNLTSGDKNIVIGSEVAFPNSTGSNQLVLANSIYGTNIYDINNANIGIRTDAPTATLDINGSLRIRGGSPGAGKILTSDVNGNASWQNASFSLDALADTAIVLRELITDGLDTKLNTNGGTITGQLRYSNGAPAAGKILTSDANGNASWQTPATPVGPNPVTFKRTTQDEVSDRTNEKINLARFSQSGTFRNLTVNTSTGAITNSSSSQVYVRVIMNMTLLRKNTSSKFTETDMWIQKNSTNSSTTNRIAHKGLIASHTSLMDQVVWEGYLQANDFINFWTWSDGAGGHYLPNFSFGDDNQYITIIEL